MISTLYNRDGFIAAQRATKRTMKSFPFILKLSQGNFFIFNQGTSDSFNTRSSNSDDCTDSIPMCSSFMCTLMANVCRKTCGRCGDGQLSLIEEMFAGFDSVQIIGPAHAIPPKPIWSEGCPLRRQAMKKHYTGFEFDTTRAGIPCQRWDSQTPQSHNITAQSPDFDHFDANYCRNPDNDPEGAWCYTMDERVRWDYCSNKNLPCDECHFENGNCRLDEPCFDPNELTEGNVICGEVEATTTRTETTTTTTVKTISWAEIKPPRTCGERHRAGQRRIINGHNAVHGENAWMVALSTANSITCGGSIITPEFVVTAAHCVALSLPEELDLYAGVHDINALATKDAPKEDLEHVQRRKTDSLFIHPQYSKFRDSSDDNDIALIKVIEPFHFTDYVAPICLPTTKASPDLWCEVTGWGDRKSKRPNVNGLTISDIFAELPVFAQFPFRRRRREETARKEKQRKGKKEPLRHSRRGKNILQTAQLDIIDFDECEMIYYDALLTLTSNMFCAKSNNGADTLSGDSGGPLQCENERGDWTLYGVTSWGLTGEEKYPGVYTSVVEFMPWIGNVLNGRIEPSDNSEQANRQEGDGRMGSPATIIEVWAPFSFF